MICDSKSRLAGTEFASLVHLRAGEDVLERSEPKADSNSCYAGTDERGVKCEHMQALVTKLLQRHWEWQEDRFHRYNTAFMANFNVKTAFDVAQPSVVSRILSLTGVLGHVEAALLAEKQDVRGSPSFENCETRQGGVAPVLGGRVAKYVLWKAEEKWKGRGWRRTIVRENDNEQKRLVCMVNDIREEMLDLDMEPKPESLWWTNTVKDEAVATLTWDLPFSEVFDVLGHRFHRDGKGSQGTHRTLCKGMGSWWRGGYIYRSKCYSMHAKYRRVLSHVYSTAIDGSVNWPWSVAMLDKGRAGQPVPCASSGGRWVCRRWPKTLWTKSGRLNWAVCHGEVPIMRALRAVLGWRTTTWWRNRSALGIHSKQMSPLGYSDVEVGGRREKLETALMT